jgi:lambda repressor-like predicted transcriptional regulator
MPSRCADARVRGLILDKDRLFNTLEMMSERASEISHEERLAEIRTRSHALVWTGPADELTATLTRWFESGWLPGLSLQEALRFASIHFVGPDGMPVIRLVPVPAPLQTPERTAANARQAFVLPLLEKQGWSILDWATEANVSHATTQDYLANKTKPYPSTRRKLADALGVSVQQLPR